MTAPTTSQQIYALEDCERLLLEDRSTSQPRGSQVVIDVELFEALIAIARQARRWGA